MKYFLRVTRTVRNYEEWSVMVEAGSLNEAIWRANDGDWDEGRMRHDETEEVFCATSWPPGLAVRVHKATGEMLALYTHPESSPGILRGFGAGGEPIEMPSTTLRSEEFREATPQEFAAFKQVINNPL